MKILSFLVYVFSKVSKATRLGSFLEKNILLSGFCDNPFNPKPQKYNYNTN